LYNRRQDEGDLRRLKALLSSNEAVVTKIAIAELAAKGWLKDGSLKDAYLSGANLEGAYLSGAKLPDGTKWTQDTDMGRFTNPSHPEFEATLKKIEQKQ
ncbi:MAG: pentapeptide repeat-containing protein, partial [Chloroflexota bacterium]